MKLFSQILAGLLITLSVAACQQNTPVQAEKLRVEENFAAADSAYSVYLQKNIGSKEAWSGRGITRINLQHYTEAEADLSEAIRIASDKKYDSRSDAKQFRGIDYFHRGIARYAQSNLEGARQDYTKAVEFGYNATEALVQRSIAWAEEQKYTECINDLTSALQLSPNDTLVLSNRAYYRSLVGDNVRALADYDALIKLSPRDKSAYLNRGYTKLQAGHTIDALADIEKSLEIDPDYIGAILYHGICLYDLGRYEEALKEFDYCENADPGVPKMAYYRGVCFMRLGKTEQGCKELRYAREKGIYDGEADFQKFCK